MPGTIERNSSNLHDADTGAMVGYKNPVTGRVEDLDTPSLQMLVAAGGISGALYDSLGKLTSYSVNGVAHTVTYPSSTSALISNELGASRTVTFDQSGRVSSVI